MIAVIPPKSGTGEVLDGAVLPAGGQSPQEVAVGSVSGLAVDRDLSIDAARGAAMLAIVLGHNTALSALAPEADRFLFLFHVPAFFLISGYLLQPCKLNVGRLARRILWPFLAVSLLLLLAKAFARGGHLGLALAGLAWGTGQTVPSSQLWFLPALFLTMVSGALIARAWGPWLNGLVVAFTFAALMALGWIGLHLPAPPVEQLRYPSVRGPIGWMWSIDLMPVALIFCLGGYLLRQSKLGVRAWVAAPAALALAAVFLLGARTDLNQRIMDPFYLSLTGGLVGALMILAIGDGFRRKGVVSSFLHVVGQRSMSILLFHVTIQNAVVRVLLSQIPGPYAMPVALVAGFVFGVLGPLGLSILYEAVLERAAKFRA